MPPKTYDLFDLILPWLDSAPVSLALFGAGRPVCLNASLTAMASRGGGTAPKADWRGTDAVSGCQEGTLTLRWADGHIFSADGCCKPLTDAGGQRLFLAAPDPMAYPVLQTIAAATYIALALTSKRSAAHALAELDAIPLSVAYRGAGQTDSCANRAFSEGAERLPFLYKTDVCYPDPLDVTERKRSRPMPVYAQYVSRYDPMGRLFWIRSSTIAACAPSGRPLANAVVFEDFTHQVDEQHTALHTALQTTRVHKDILDRSRTVAFSFSLAEPYRLTYISQSVRVFGYASAALLATGFSFPDFFDYREREELRLWLEQPFSDAHHVKMLSLRDQSDRIHPMQVHLRRVEQDGVRSMVGVLVNIGRQTALRTSLQEKSLSVRERLELYLANDPIQVNMDMPLLSLIDSQSVQRHQAALARIFDLTVTAFDPDGNLLTTPSGTSAMTEFVRRSNAAASAFIAELRELARRAGRHLRIQQVRSLCTGLEIAAIPMFHGEKHLATWIIGQVRLEERPPDSFAHTCRSLELDPETALSLYASLPLCPQKRFTDAILEINRMVSVFAVSYTNSAHLLTQTELARQANAKINRSLSRQRLVNEIFFLTRSAGSLSEAMNGVLASIGEDQRFSRAYIFEKKPSGLLSIVYEWHADDFDAIPWEHRALFFDAGENIPFSSDGLVVYDSSVPPEGVIRARNQATGVQSAVYFPVFAAGELIYLLVFEECRISRAFSQQDREYLDILLRLVANIVQVHRVEQVLMRSRSVFDTVMYNLDLSVLTYDPETMRILYVNAHCQKMTGLPQHALTHVRMIFPELEDIDGLSGREDGHVLELERGDRVFLTILNTIAWLDGRPVRIVSAADITSLRETERTIERLAYSDTLMNIPNRRKFEDDLDAALSCGASSCALLFMDLDDFKMINDSFGHQRGDQLLRQIGLELSAIPLVGGHLYRLGGDEFMALLEDIDADTLADTVERVWSRFQQPWILEGVSVYSTVSIGVSRFPEDGDTARELLRHADMAMYKAKYEGKNSAVFFRRGLEGGLSHRMLIETRLQRSVKNGCADFCVYYQPIVRLDTGALAGAEALIRWRDPDQVLHRPDVFLEAAESLGLMPQIGAFVYRTTFADMKRFAREGFHLVINLSITQLQDTRAVESLSELLAESGFPAGSLVLSISENTAVLDTQSGENTLQRLRALGLKIALDNNGSSYNALSRVWRERIDFVNIDISLIGNMQHDPFSDIVVQSSIEMARAAGCRVFCTGVEAQEQVLDLREYGGDFAEGYYYSAPLTGPEFEAYVSNPPESSRRMRRSELVN